MKITVLAENTAKTNDFLAEHGLSLLINSNGKNILFDCGQTDAFIKNAKTLGIDLSIVDFLVLSHGHYDHGGGLKDFLKVNKTAKLYLPKNAFDKHYNGSEKYIGLSPDLCDERRIVTVDGDLKIADGVTVKRLTKEPFNIDSAGLTVNINGKFLPDNFEHERYLSIVENGKEYLFSGCTHKGLDNVLSNFTPDVFVGGFHLSKVSLLNDKDRLDQVADLLIKTGAKFYTCHCTGLAQFDYLKDKLKDNLHYLSTGDCRQI